MWLVILARLFTLVASCSGTHPERNFHAHVTFGTGGLRDTESVGKTCFSVSTRLPKQHRLFYTNAGPGQFRLMTDAFRGAFRRSSQLPGHAVNIPRGLCEIQWYAVYALYKNVPFVSFPEFNSGFYACKRERRPSPAVSDSRMRILVLVLSILGAITAVRHPLTFTTQRFRSLWYFKLPPLAASLESQPHAKGQSKRC